MSIWHLVILLAVVLLIFGTGKLGKIGGDLGSAIRGFKQSMSDDPAPDRLRAEPTAASQPANAPDRNSRGES